MQWCATEPDVTCVSDLQAVRQRLPLALKACPAQGALSGWHEGMFWHDFCCCSRSLQLTQNMVRPAAALSRAGCQIQMHVLHSRCWTASAHLSASLPASPDPAIGILLSGRALVYKMTRLLP